MYSLENRENTMLSPLFDSGRFFHAYIISGGSSEDRLAASKAMAAAMVCSGIGKRPCGSCAHCRKAEACIHPDIKIIESENDRRELSVDQIRTMRSDSIVLPNEAEKKVYIINNTETMNSSSQNAMLKILEEPPSYAVFILLIENPGFLLETVRSRCVEINLVRDFSEIAAIDGDSPASQLLDILDSRDKFRLVSFSFYVERMGKGELEKISAEIKQLAAARIRNSLNIDNHVSDFQMLSKIIKTFDEVDVYLKYNVNIGHIMGFVLTELL